MGRSGNGEDWWDVSGHDYIDVRFYAHSKSENALQCKSLKRRPHFMDSIIAELTREHAKILAMESDSRVCAAEKSQRARKTRSTFGELSSKRSTSGCA